VADTKVSGLTAGTAPRGTWLVPAVDAVNTSAKKITLDQVRQTGVFSVKDYGALGDNSTNDTAAFHSARDAAGTNGTVIVPPGTYKVTLISLSVAGQTWRIERGATITQIAATNTSMIEITAADITLTGDGTLDGNATNNASQPRMVYVKTAGDRARISSLRLTNWRGYGIQNHRSGVEVTGCYMTGSLGTAVFYQVSGADIQGGRVSGNHIVLTGTTLQNDHIALFSDGVSPTYFVYDVIVTDNRLMSDVGSIGLPIELWFGAHRSVVANNHIENGNYGISVASSDNCVISGNYIRGCTIECSGNGGTYTGNVSDGITATYGHAGLAFTNAATRGNLISGNTFRNWGQGITINVATQDVTITGNTFLTNGVSTPLGNDIEIGGAPRGVLITSNVFSQCIGNSSIYIGNSNVPLQLSIVDNYFHTNVDGIHSYANAGWGNPFVVRGNVYDGSGSLISHGNVLPTGSFVDENTPSTFDAARRSPGVFSVKDYGAKGDGSTDDTTAILNAHTAAGTGGTLIFPPGVYIAGNLDFDISGQVIQVLPGATLKEKANTGSAGQPWIRLSAPRIRLTGGGIIDGNTANQSTHGWATVSIQKGTAEADDCTIDSLHFINWEGYATLFSCHRATVRDNLFDTSGVGSGAAVQAWNSATQTVLTGSLIKGNRVYVTTTNQNGMGVHSDSNGTGQLVTWLNIEDNYIECTRIGIESWNGCNYSMVRNNTIAVYQEMGISLADNFYNTITGNVIKSPSSGGSDACSIEAGTSYSTFSNNVLLGDSTNGWGGIGCYWSSAIGNTFSGNIIKNCRNGIGLSAGAKNATIVGNYFEACGPYAGAVVKLNGGGSGSGAVVANNIFQSTPGGNNDIQIGWDNVRVEGNVHIASDTCVYIESGHTDIFVMNNTFSGSNGIYHQARPTVYMYDENSPATWDLPRIGNPKSLATGFMLPNGWQHDAIESMTLTGSADGSVLGTGELIISDDTPHSSITLLGKD